MCFRLESGLCFRLESGLCFRLESGLCFRLESGLCFRLESGLCFRLESGLCFRLESGLHCRHRIRFAFPLASALFNRNPFAFANVPLLPSGFRLLPATAAAVAAAARAASFFIHLFLPTHIFYFFHFNRPSFHSNCLNSPSFSFDSDSLDSLIRFDLLKTKYTPPTFFFS
ncbi:hypothetical protein MmiHf6_02650 [Methanimicrococcus hongohii]|uniref:Uncharacterized protein n=1 Tax=Methanimicrococcus hongohii TaxID=3028295 RepID=A0AA96ZTA6_9EURY|nr:hypothetical protein MmiHf6_02650 [Methanimicrococcus sp. Hf6]